MDRLAWLAGKWWVLAGAGALDWAKNTCGREMPPKVDFDFACSLRLRARRFSSSRSVGSSSEDTGWVGLENSLRFLWRLPLSCSDLRGHVTSLNTALSNHLGYPLEERWW